MRIRIDTISGRRSLAPRRNPYFAHRIRKGLHLGFRCTGRGGVGFWIVRGAVEHEYRFKSLYEVSDTNTFEVALAAAQAWASELDHGVGANLSGRKADVELACAEYVASLQSARPRAAHDADLRFKRYVYGHALARVPLDKLREKNIRQWLDGLLAAGLTKSGANRTLIALRAALNASVRSRLAPSHTAFEIRQVQPFKGAATRRNLFLDQAQRKALHESARGAVRDLIAAAALTGARPGELVNARRSAFDARTGTITLTGKVGSRTIPLSPDACALFERLSKNKLPTAYLLVKDNGERWTRTSEWATLVKDAASRAGLPQDVVLYSLRHSAISEMLKAGMATLEVARLVGTSLGQIEEHYGHIAQPHVREQLARVKLL